MNNLTRVFAGSAAIMAVMAGGCDNRPNNNQSGGRSAAQNSTNTPTHFASKPNIKSGVEFQLTGGLETMHVSTNGQPVTIRPHAQYVIPNTATDLILTPDEIIPQNVPNRAIAVQRYEGHVIILPTTDGRFFLPAGTWIGEPDGTSQTLDNAIELKVQPGTDFLHVIAYSELPVHQRTLLNKADPNLQQSIQQINAAPLDSQRLVQVDMESLKVTLSSGDRDYARNGNLIGRTTAFVLQYDVANNVGLTPAMIEQRKRSLANPTTDPVLMSEWTCHVWNYHGVPPKVADFGLNFSQMLITPQGTPVPTAPSPNGP